MRNLPLSTARLRGSPVCSLKNSLTLPFTSVKASPATAGGAPDSGDGAGASATNTAKARRANADTETPLSLGILAVLVAVTPAGGQDKAGEIDKIFAWATPNAPACAASISDHGKLVVNRAYGSADLERDFPLIFIGKLYDTKSWPSRGCA
jgi:CubicO group peptidase (beta-lactamase class C family)